MLTAKGLEACVKLLVGCEGLHVCPKMLMLPNADPGELNPKDWPNDEGWLAAAATDPNNPLDAVVVEGEPKIDDVALVTTGAPKIDDVVLVTAGAPKMDDVVVDAEPNIELDEVETVGLPNIDELVVAIEPKIVLVVWLDPKPPVVFVVVADPNIEDTVVEDGVPNIDVVFVEFPKIDDEVVVILVPNTEEVVVVPVGVPNIDDEVVPKIEEVLVVFVVVTKIDVVLVVFVGVLNIEEALVLVVLVIDVWPIVLLIFSKMLVVLVKLIEVVNFGVLVDGVSQSNVLLAVSGTVGIFSFSGVTGSDIIGVGISETLGVFSITLIVVVVVSHTGLISDVVLTIPKVEETTGELTGSLTIVESVFDAIEKLNDAVTVVGNTEVKMDLDSDVVFAISFLDALKLNVENDTSGLELKLKEANVGSFGTVSWLLFLDLSSVMRPENILWVSKGLGKVFGASKLKVVLDTSCKLPILFIVGSVKFNMSEVLIFCTNVSEGALVKENFFSFESTPEIISNVDFVETKLLVLLTFKGAVVEFKLKSTGSLQGSLILLVPNIETGAVELIVIGSLMRSLNSNGFVVASLGVEVLSKGFHTVAMPVFVDKGLDTDGYVLVMEATVIGVVCVVGINIGFLNCVISDVDTGISAALFSSLE